MKYNYVVLPLSYLMTFWSSVARRMWKKCPRHWVSDVISCACFTLSFVNLKAKLGVSYRLLSAVSLSVNYFHVHTVFQNHWVCLNKGPRSFLRGNYDSEISTFKNLLITNHWVKFNQTWHKHSWVPEDCTPF